ncbi:hypothetical protein HNY73_011661 [Argiope bruennichi]|uniref:Uncharacterized protein n=1 Tax=Argiope bruennichi TaxID=94029 RepID=A0A8T0F0W4_ARGBR|nr:hypothetical protein HNY73_011661 [Argiope bruennichi]
MVIPLSMLAFAIYYPTFYFTIMKMNVMTPGRGDDVQLTHLSGGGDKSDSSTSSVSTADAKYERLANAIIEGVGKDNILNLITVLQDLELKLKIIQKLMNL